MNGIDPAQKRIEVLEGALAEIYFYLGPPQPHLEDHAQVPTLVERAMVERDRLRRVVEADNLYSMLDLLEGYQAIEAELGDLRVERDRLRAQLQETEESNKPQSVPDERLWGVMCEILRVAGYPDIVDGEGHELGDVIVGMRWLAAERDRLWEVVLRMKTGLELLADDSDVGVPPEQELNGMRRIAKAALRAAGDLDTATGANHG